MRKTFIKYHSLIFTIFSYIGLQLCLYSFNISKQNFIFTATLFLLIFSIENIFSLKYALNIKSKLILPHIIDDSKKIHISNNIILPLILYIGLLGFIFFNTNSLATQLILLIGAITFYSIFEGQRKTFENEFSFTETLQYIFDSIKIMIFFLMVNLFIQASSYYDLGNLPIVIGTEFISLILFILIVVRKKEINIASAIYIFISSIIISVITIFLTWVLTSSLAASLLSTVIFYLLVGLLHHKINATLTLGVILEYIVIAFIIILSIFGISR